MQKRVLIADSDPGLTTQLSELCRGIDAEPVVETDAMHAVCAAVPTWDGSLLDLCIVNESHYARLGLSFCEEIIAQNVWMPIPVIAVTDEEDVEAAARCDRLGVCRVTRSAEAVAELRPLVLRLLDVFDPTGESDPSDDPHEPPRSLDSSPRVLCIDDDEAFVMTTEKRLHQFGIEVLGASSGMEGFWKALKHRPAAILTDYAMPEGYATYLVRRLKEHSLTRDIPIVVITGRNASGRAVRRKDSALEQQLVEQGAECVLAKPLNVRRLVEELRHWPVFADPKPLHL